MSEPGFWPGRRVLVTGHTGFKGAWLSLWLEQRGAQVFGYADGVPTEPSLYVDAGLDATVTSTNGDVADAATLSGAVAEAQPSVVFHFAAQSLVRRSFDEPVATLRTNVEGTAHLLEAVRRHAAVIDAVVVATSDKCYENNGWEYGYRETDPLGGRDPYSVSKAAAELVVRSYRDSFFAGDAAPRVATVRAGNVIGGGDWAEDRLIPDLVRAARSRDASVTLRNPSAERPWQHVLDCLNGYLVLAERLVAEPDLAGPWNLGPDPVPPVTVGDVVERFVMALGRDLDVAQATNPALPEEARLALDTARARRRLGWSPRLGLEESLELTAGWYAGYLRGEDARALTLSQIEAFEVR